MPATISNTDTSTQYVNDGDTITPFTGVVFGETNPVGLQTITITLNSADDGTIIDPSHDSDGSIFGSNGVFTLSNVSDTTATAIIEKLIFKPNNPASNGSYRYTSFKIDVQDQYGYSASTNDTVISIGAPIITGTVSNQPDADTSTIKPFATVGINEYTYYPYQTGTATITITDNGIATDADGYLSGGGLSKNGTGSYIVYYTGSGYTLQNELNQLIFTPSTVTPNTSKTVNFDLNVFTTGTPKTKPLSTDDNKTSVLIRGQTINYVAPSITGTSASQSVTDGASITPFSGVNISDSNSGATDSVTITVSGGGTLHGAGLIDNGNGVYTLNAATPQTITSEIEALTYSSATDATANLTIKVTDSYNQTASDNKTTIISKAAIPPPDSNFRVSDQTTHDTREVTGSTYTGPVANVKNQYVVQNDNASISADNLNITAITPNVFIHSGSGEDAIDVSGVGGTNVLDGYTGSNFLVGGLAGSGKDQFFVDDRGAPSDIWSTVVNFHAGDTATIWGISQAGFTITKSDNQGADGYKGFTIDLASSNNPDAKLTLAGLSMADENVKFKINFGTDSTSGSNFMLVTAS